VDGVTVLTYVLPGACTNDNGMASCEYTETTVDCSQDNGKVCDAGACVEPPPVLNPPAVGEVIFTEFMAKSMGGTDVGEWVEIYNTTNEIIDLDNCHLKDLGSDNHTIVGSLSIAANGYLLLAKSDVPADNHGLPAPGYVYTSYTLSNSSDELVLECGEEVVIDKVEYDGGWVAEGVSYQLKTDQMDATANDDIANWCASTQEYGTAQKLGTPGAENTVCQ
jgi:hypothetical protein